MTLRDRELVAPELLVIVSSRDDAVALSPLATVHDEARTTLVATGPDPMLVDEVLDELGTPAGRILLPEGVTDGREKAPALEMAGLLPRLDEVLAENRPAAVVVRGGTTTALAGAQAAAWRGVSLIAVGAPLASRTHAANRSMIMELAAWQSSEAGATVVPAWLDLVVHQRMAAAADPTGRVIGLSPGRPTRSVAPGLSA